MAITFHIYFLSTNRSPLNDSESIDCCPFSKGIQIFKERAAEENILAGGNQKGDLYFIGGGT